MPAAQDGRKVVVVIDADPLGLEGMGGLLRSWGYGVVAARSDSAALVGIDELRRQPDLIISDYRLADGKTGVEAIARLRDLFPVPALLISGEIAPEQLRDAGASGYRLLHKPVRPAALRTVLGQLLENGGGGESRLQIRRGL